MHYNMTTMQNIENTQQKQEKFLMNNSTRNAIPLLGDSPQSSVYGVNKKSDCSLLSDSI